jgi:hypothetical protein
VVFKAKPGFSPPGCDDILESIHPARGGIGTAQVALELEEAQSAKRQSQGGSQYQEEGRPGPPQNNQLRGVSCRRAAEDGKRRISRAETEGKSQRTIRR